MILQAMIWLWEGQYVLKTEPFQFQIQLSLPIQHLMEVQCVPITDLFQSEIHISKTIQHPFMAEVLSVAVGVQMSLIQLLKEIMHASMGEQSSAMRNPKPI